MPGFTQNKGLIYPVQGDRSHTGLSPDVPGSFDLLQEQLDTLLVAKDAEIADLTDRVAALEAATAASRWRHINSGIQAGAGSIVIPVPAGFERLRLKVVGDLTDQGQVNLRINGDSSANYSWGFAADDVDGSADFRLSNFASTAWRLAEWSSVESNTIDVDISPTNGDQNPSMLAFGTQVATGATSHRREVAWGKYTGDVVVSSVTISEATTVFANVQWWLEGFLSS